MNNNESLQYKLLPLVYVISMTFVTWTLLYSIPIINRTWMWLLLSCVISFYLIRDYYSSKVFKYFTFYIIIVLLNVLTNDFYFNSLPLAINEIAGIVFVSSACAFFLNNPSNKVYNIFLMVFFIIILITTYLSYIINLSLPGAIREITVSGFGGDNSLVKLYYSMGMGSYGMAHALPVIIPPLVMAIKHKKMNIFSRVVLIICLIAVAIYIYLGAASGALIIGILSLTISLFVRPGTIKSNVGRLVIISILFLPFLNNELLLFVLEKFEILIGGEGAYQMKIDEFRKLAMTGEQGTDITARLNLYNNSWDGFVENFLIGTNDEIGGHSAIIDRFATMGVLGIIPFLFFLFKQLKYPLLFFDKNYSIYYFIGAFSGVLMLLTKNMGNWEMWLCLFLVLPTLTMRLMPKKNYDI